MGSEKERQRWGRGEAKVTEKGDVNYRDMQTFDRADGGGGGGVGHVHKLQNSDKEAKGISTIKSKC